MAHKYDNSVPQCAVEKSNLNGIEKQFIMFNINIHIL